MENENKYLYSKAYFKIKELIFNNPKENIFVICGGQGAGKTVSIIELIIQSLLSTTKEATVLSSELSKMKKTVIRDYNKICRDWNVFRSEEDFNKSESKHEYQNGSYIDFLGVDVNDVGKGFRRDILYINEGDKITLEAANQFISRAGITIMDYNPDAPFWSDDFINDNNFLRLTFEDNEFLSESEKKSILEYKVKGFIDPNATDLFHESNIKSKYWSNKWRVYGCGLTGFIDGCVFEDWEIVDDLPKEARLLYYGCDFGYAVSKFAVVGIYQYNNTFILHELVYDTMLTNQKAAEQMKVNGYVNGTIVYCDSAEPKSIQELFEAGITALPCESKQDIKPFAIQKLNSQTFFVTKNSINLVDELRANVWDEKTMKIKKSNKDHLIDALLYAVGSDGKFNGVY